MTVSTTLVTHIVKPSSDYQFTPMYLRCCLLLALACVSTSASAGDWFEDATDIAGITHSGPTAGSAWGDLNGDSWPDLWVSDHVFGNTKPVLLLNNKNGTFTDVSSMLQIDPMVDVHGGAWADFDEDGDQDLVVLAGGGGGGGPDSTPSANLLLRNDKDRFTDIASSQGVAMPQGRGRTPLWLDADNDGKLDLLISNKHVSNNSQPTSLYIQEESSFTPAKFILELPPTPRSALDNAGLHILNLLKYRRQAHFGSIIPTEVFAQLSDVNNDKKIDLITYGHPTRVHSLTTNQPSPLAHLYIGTELDVSDVASADFDGDGKFDFYILRSSAGAQDVVQPNPQTLIARLNGSSTGKTKELLIKTGAVLRALIVDPWEITDRLPPVRIGKSTRVPATSVFELDPANPANLGPVPRTQTEKEILIEYLPEASAWKISNFAGRMHLQFEAVAGTIQGFETDGFSLSKGLMRDKLLLQTSGAFDRAEYISDDQDLTACQSVAAADFDNDMDVDLFLSCADPVQNGTNKLFANQGNGVFTSVVNAGGAAGSKIGRSDAVTTADYDGDGFLDLFVTNGAGSAPFSDKGPYQLFRNLGNTNHWLEIDLTGTESNIAGIGAIVEITAGGVSQIRQQAGGIHSFAQDHSRIHVGLGNNLRIDQIKIWWPSGIVQTLKDIPANQILEVQEPTRG